MKPTHLDADGHAHMVDVGEKPITRREARAEGVILVQPATLRAIAESAVAKGDVFSAARIAGIMAAKRCGELIPLCHSLPVESVEIHFGVAELEPDKSEPIRIYIDAVARVTAKTGVEMEALAAVSVAALTIYDMCKSIDKTMQIEGIRLLSKTGGRSGDYRAAPSSRTRGGSRPSRNS